MLRYKTKLDLIQLPCMTYQETERVYSYNPGACTGPTEKELCSAITTATINQQNGLYISHIIQTAPNC